MSQLIDAPPRAAVTVVSGFRAHATQTVAHDLLAIASASAVLVHHDLSRLHDGLVRRIVCTQDRVLEDETIQLVHGCISCTLREDVLPTLVRLAQANPSREIVLLLPEAIEPDAVDSACAHCLVGGDPVTRWVHMASYVTVVDAPTFLDDLDSDEDLVHRGMQAANDDHRAVASVVARQVEFADTVLLHGTDQLDPLALLRLQVLLHRLAPWAEHLDDKQDLSGTRSSSPDRLDAVVRGLAGYSLGVHEPVNDSGVISVLFRARRPMHPQRLQAALPWLATTALRSRGHVWLATQPDQVIGWESAGGGIALRNLGRWLAALPEHRWHEASDLRRLAAQLEWDPYYGDRGHHLLFIGIGLDPAELHQSLTACLLTDDELALGEDGWKHLPDPFAGCFTHHHADTEDSP